MTLAYFTQTEGKPCHHVIIDFNNWKTETIKNVSLHLIDIFHLQMEFQDFLMDLLYTTHSIQSRTYFCACRHFQRNWRRWEWNSTPKSNCRAEQQTAKLATREGLRLFDSLGSVLASDWACLHLVKFVSQPFLWFTDKLSLSNGQSTQHPGCLCNCIMENSKYICGFV